MVLPRFPLNGQQTQIAPIVAAAKLGLTLASAQWRACNASLTLCGKQHRDYPRAMRLCLFEPEIAGNVGAVMRLGACMGVPVDLIEPMGFTWDDKRVRRTAMDYVDHVDVTRHRSFDDFRSATPGRLILFTTKGDASPYDFTFCPNDLLLFGKESGGVPADIAACCDARLRLPIRAQVRSFNLATAAALALGEALRQTDGLPA